MPQRELRGARGVKVEEGILDKEPERGFGMKRTQILALTALASVLLASFALAGGEKQTKQAAPRKGAPWEKKADAADANKPLPYVILREKPSPERLKALEGLKFVSAGEYPKTGGSTSAHPLGVKVACALMGYDCVWERPNSGPWAVAGGNAERRLWPAKISKDAHGNMEIDKAPWHYHIWHEGTNQAYVRLIEGGKPLIYECRPPSEDEVKLAREKGVELELCPIAWDAFVFLLHEKNKDVDGLTARQVREVYSGKLKNWAQLGGADKDIHAYIRNRNSGSQEVMEQVVMSGKPTIGPATGGRNMMGMSMTGPYNLMAGDPQGMGYTFYYYHKYMSPTPGIKLAKIDGAAPSAETIASGEYPFCTEVYVVTRKGLKDSEPAAKVRDWLFTAAGQKAVAQSGYVSLKK